ncbi:cation transporter [Lactobacillus sp. DCY120]|uniref:Cation transporter n=1 Tax=Bombilactobacillus apium TaxID=2675299 RepID=A0A850R589_9LACO|nr:cation diffusion facilitator family transporter [Bombilactobacillus apium]NVY96017.1 cation transporter [Bombilactobacillus apium]
MDTEHQHELSPLKFAGVTILNALITIAELVGGTLSGSLGLISDGFHNMEDTLSVVFSFVANLIGHKDSNERQTFGYSRVEILAAFINSAILIAITLILVFESLKRFSHPQPVNGGLMFWVSLISLGANFISMLVMLKGSKYNLNIKATFLHMAADTLSSVGVIIAAVLIQLFNWVWADPMITVITAIWIMKESFGVVKQTVLILMEASPNLDLEAIKESLLTIPAVVGVHHVHVWRINENLIAFDAHINVQKTATIEQLEALYQQIETLLAQEYNIQHVTLQAECMRGLDQKLIHPRS